MLASSVDHRELEAPLLEAFQIEDEAGAIPEQDLHLVARLADEDEEMPGEGILPERAFNEGAEPVDALTHVGELGREVDADAGRQTEHHPPSRRATTRANAASSKP